MKKGDKVIVYQDPITCEKVEDRGEIVEVLRDLNERDINGRSLYRATVQFTDGPYFRIVSD